MVGKNMAGKNGEKKWREEMAGKMGLSTCVSGIGDTAVGDEGEEGIQTPPLHAALLELETNAVDAEEAHDSKGQVQPFFLTVKR